MNRNSKEAFIDRLIKEIDLLVGNKYGNAYGDGEPFSRICPSVYLLSDQQLIATRNMVAMKPYAANEADAKYDVISLMCAVEAASGQNRREATAERMLETANEMGDSRLGKRVVSWFSSMLSAKKEDLKENVRTEEKKLPENEQHASQQETLKRPRSRADDFHGR